MAEPAFQDYERECFGDEDGCDLYYYGETPEDVKNRLLEKERPAGATQPTRRGICASRS